MLSVDISFNIPSSQYWFFGLLKLISASKTDYKCIINIFQGNTETLESGFEDTGTDTSLLVLSFYNGLWAYDGWWVFVYRYKENSTVQGNLNVIV